MSDFGLFLENNEFDLVIENDDLKGDDGLETALAISLFTDRRVTDEQLPDFAVSKRGYWGDMYPEVDQDKIGSRMWTLEREKKTSETLRTAEDFTREALQWLIEDVIADSFTVTASYDSSNFLLLDIKILRPDESESRYGIVWDSQKIRRL